MRDIIFYKESLDLNDQNYINSLTLNPILIDSLNKGINSMSRIEKAMMNGCLKTCLKYIEELKKSVQSFKLKKLQDSIQILIQFVKNRMNFDYLLYLINNIKSTLQILVNR